MAQKLCGEAKKFLENEEPSCLEKEVLQAKPKAAGEIIKLLLERTLLVKQRQNERTETEILQAKREFSISINEFSGRSCGSAQFFYFLIKNITLLVLVTKSHRLAS